MSMHPEDRVKFPDDFPQVLVDLARSLAEWGLEDLEVIDSVWKYKDIKQVINFLVDAHYVIRGGDVYVDKLGKLLELPDSWSIQDPDARLLRERSESDREHILEESRKQSLSYVENYWKRNGDDYYYSIVFSDADPHRTQHKLMRSW